MNFMELLVLAAKITPFRPRPPTINIPLGILMVLGGRWRGKVQISPEIRDFNGILRNCHKIPYFW